MANPYGAPPSAPPVLGAPLSRWRYLPVSLCLAFAAWLTVELAMSLRSVSTLDMGNDMIHTGYLLMYSLIGLVCVLVVLAAIFAAYRAWRGRWLTALIVPPVGFLAIMLTGSVVGPYVFDWYLAYAQGV